MGQHKWLSFCTLAFQVAVISHRRKTMVVLLGNSKRKTSAPVTFEGIFKPGAQWLPIYYGIFWINSVACDERALRQPFCMGAAEQMSAELHGRFHLCKWGGRYHSTKGPAFKKSLLWHYAQNNLFMQHENIYVLCSSLKREFAIDEGHEKGLEWEIRRD